MNKSNLTRRELRLERDKRTAVIRAQERISRKGRRYNPYKSSVISHQLRVNQNVLIDGSRAGKSIVKSPKVLDFRGQSEDALRFLREIREEVINGKTHNVLVDLTALEEISPACAVVLLAEMTRCATYSNRAKRLTGNFPKTDRAKQLLTDIGFFRSFQVRAPEFAASKESRVYVKTIAGNRSDGRYTKPVIHLFEQVCQFNPVAGKRLYGALIECMDNVKGHAYPANVGDRPDLIGEWWMCGFADPVNRQLALVFYDQGEGIPRTIKRVRSIRMRSYLNFDDSRILKKAITLGLSSKKDKRRGTGLPSLREFVDYAPGGFLRVISGTGDVRYIGSTKRIETKRLTEPLAGSLIVWTIRETPDNGEVESESDLQRPTGPVQLRFDYE
jgi:anti-anti-sigma regulatory factor